MFLFIFVLRFFLSSIFLSSFFASSFFASLLHIFALRIFAFSRRSEVLYRTPYTCVCCSVSVEAKAKQSTQMYALLSFSRITDITWTYWLCLETRDETTIKVVQCLKVNIIILFENMQQWLSFVTNSVNLTWGPLKFNIQSNAIWFVLPENTASYQYALVNSSVKQSRG